MLTMFIKLKKMLLTSAFLITPEVAMAHTYKVEKIKGELSITKNNTIIRLTAPSNRWFLIGFKKSNTLHNAKIFFARIIENNIFVEEHRTNFNPLAPYHQKAQLNSNKIKVLEGENFNGFKTVLFEAPLEGEHKNQVSLSRPQGLFITLTYSFNNNLQHHSIRKVRAPPGSGKWF